MSRTGLLAVLTAGLSAMLLAVPAAAQRGFEPPADTYYRRGPQPAADAQYLQLWSGGYIGAHLGHGEADPGDGFLGGVQAGFNWQSGRLVYGLEIDATWADISEEEEVSLCDSPTTCVSARVESTIDWMATLRGRVGYLVTPDLMPYVTAGFGLVSGSASASVRVSDSALSPIDDDDTETDFVYGIGLEGRLGSATLLRVEYLGYSDTEIDVIRAGLSFRLGGTAY